MTTFTRIVMDHDVFPVDKSAVHAALQSRDTYARDGVDHQATDFEHGRDVESFTSQLGSSHHFAVGSTLIVRNLSGQEILWARIDRIRMMDTKQFTDDDYHALGFKNAADHGSGWGALVSGGKVWMLDITPIDPDKP